MLRQRRLQIFWSKRAVMNCRVTTITSLCRWKPLRRFCSAVHNVDRACISVLSQVIRNVNEKKNRTDKYDFLREPWRWDSKNFVKLLLHKIFAQKSIGMPGEQEYHICLYDFSFSSTLIKTCGRTLISAPSHPAKAPQNLWHYASETPVIGYTYSWF